MEDRFETTFVVEAPRKDVWQALQDAQPVPAGHGEWWLPAFESPGDELEVDEGRFLRVRKAAEPCANTEIAITLETVDAGTKVTVVQSGFGRGFEQMLNALSIGWSHIAADLVLFFEHGVRGGRHRLPWASLGCSLREVPAGLEVRDVFGGLAEQAGLERGDVLVAVGNAPVVYERELQTLMRVFHAGDKVDVTWARGGSLLHGAGIL